MRGTRTWTAIVATTALAFTLAACGGGDDAASEDPTVTDAPTAALDTDVQDAVQVIDACQKYFAFDLKMSEMAGAEDAKKKKKRDILAELKGLTDEMVLSSEEAYISGELPERVLINANRIQRNLGRVPPKDGIDGIKNKQMNRIESSAARIERSCEAAGDMLPQENLDARTAA
ncbi:MAG TPA: hypothetical protein VGP37_04150 [Candidatus Nanopelagicales bacterium]|nr:hypothetical protein [Candidatus Nanopelagicales bacterium]